MESMQHGGAAKDDSGPAPPSIESMLFSVEVSQSGPASYKAAAVPPGHGSHHITFDITISFGFLTTWTVQHRYSKVRTFAKALRSILHASSSSRCTEISDKLVAIVNAGLPSSHRFLHLLQSRPRFIATRAMALQSYIEGLLNTHARCIMQCGANAGSDFARPMCYLVQQIQTFLGMDKEPSILQNIGGYIRPAAHQAPPGIDVDSITPSITSASKATQVP
ncbi:hypothetical protein H310_10931 [Aphanomyces invadans]|uniref:PX domain-containing protein n=1 Tax=Aphanomyces invadans TaxID=157072 RepID=A0A024TPH5_9STRA|nr:hypothetical protein H310_10931 [Aphanomyces invadans]ETV95893.1 hypothetical protein H310_10931 [Aphanomyces invadans]|eukprot:XP_008875644.1 hypothetical protein H310_10931 [Aphanomyces invadans]